MTDLIERLLDNAATAAQERSLLRNDEGGETVLRESVRINVAKPLLDALEAKERDIIATRTALLLANERGLTGVAIAKDAPLNYLLDIPGYIGKENDRLWAKVELLAATVTRIANIAARLAEIARSVHIGDLERAEISALELELVKETL